MSMMLHQTKLFLMFQNFLTSSITKEAKYPKAFAPEKPLHPSPDQEPILT
jgi:hypothetical protein